MVHYLQLSRHIRALIFVRWEILNQFDYHFPIRFDAGGRENIAESSFSLSIFQNVLVSDAIPNGVEFIVTTIFRFFYGFSLAQGHFWGIFFNLQIFRALFFGCGVNSFLSYDVVHWIRGAHSGLAELLMHLNAIVFAFFH